MRVGAASSRPLDREGTSGNAYRGITVWNV